MIEIKDLLSKWSKILLSEDAKKETILEVIFNTIGVKLNKEDVEIKQGTVYLKIKPIYKNQIFIKREEIDQNLEKIFGDKKPKELR
jgi:hypothetical protein